MGRGTPNGRRPVVRVPSGRVWRSGAGGFIYQELSASYPPGEVTVLIRSRRGAINRVAQITFYPPSEDREWGDAYVDIARRGRGAGTVSHNMLYRRLVGGTYRRYQGLTTATIGRLTRLTGA